MSLGVSQFGDSTEGFIFELRNGLNEFSAGIGELGGPLIRTTTISSGYQFSMLWDEMKVFRIKGHDVIGSDLPFWINVDLTGLVYGTAIGDTIGRGIRFQRDSEQVFFDAGWTENNNFYFTRVHDSGTGNPLDWFACLRIDNEGRIGIGVNETFPIINSTAYLHLAPGRADAGFSPFKFSLTNAALLTVPEPGVMEPDSAGNLYYTPVATRRKFAFTDGETFTGNIVITTPGTLTVSSDSDVTTILGRSVISSPSSDQAFFSHFDFATNTNYALKQDASGGTMVNAVTGQNVDLRINNVAVFTVASNSVRVADQANILFSTSTGSRIGNAATQKFAFWGSTPMAQPSTTGETAGFTPGVGTAVNDDSTFTGNVGTKAYTIGDIVKHLKNVGLLAAS